MDVDYEMYRSLITDAARCFVRTEANTSLHYFTAEDLEGFFIPIVLPEGKVVRVAFEYVDESETNG